MLGYLSRNANCADMIQYDDVGSRQHDRHASSSAQSSFLLHCRVSFHCSYLCNYVAVNAALCCLIIGKTIAQLSHSPLDETLSRMTLQARSPRQSPNGQDPIKLGRLISV